jgi:hypothetical protein
MNGIEFAAREAVKKAEMEGFPDSIKDALINRGKEMDSKPFSLKDHKKFRKILEKEFLPKVHWWKRVLHWLLGWE